MLSQKNKIVWSVVVVIVVAAIAFYSGMKYGQGGNAGQAGTGNYSLRMGTSTRSGSRAFGGMVSGQILSMDANSITISTQGGGSRIVFLSASTTIGMMTNGTVKDLAAGQNVTINGSANPDNSLNAQMIQIRPAIQSK